MSKKKKNNKNRVVDFHLNNLILDENDHVRFANVTSKLGSWLIVTKQNQWLFYSLSIGALSGVAIPIDRYVLNLLWPYHKKTIGLELTDYDADSARKLFGGIINYSYEGSILDALGLYAFAKSTTDGWIPDWWPNSIPEIKSIYVIERGESEDEDEKEDITKVFDAAIKHINDAYCDKHPNAFYISGRNDTFEYTPTTISYDYSDHMKCLKVVYGARPKKTRLISYQLTPNFPIYAYQTKFVFRLLLDTTIVNLKFLGYDSENSDSVESDIVDILEPMDKTLYLNAANLAFLNWIGKKHYLEHSSDKKARRYYRQLKDSATAAYGMSITYGHGDNTRRTEEFVDCFPSYAPPMLDSVVYAAARFANANRVRLPGDYDEY